MKKSGVGLFVLAVLFQSEWSIFQNLQGGFSVFSPAPLTEKTTLAKTKIGEIECHTFYFHDDAPAADNVFYLVKWWDFPAATVHSDSTAMLADFWRTTLDGEAENLGGKIAYEADAPFLEFPGKTARVFYRKGTATAKIRLFLVKNRLFTLETLTSRDHQLNAASDRFIESFRLLAP